MQWSGLQGGAAPFEGAVPATFTTERTFQTELGWGRSRAILPMGNHGGLLEASATLKPRKGELMNEIPTLMPEKGFQRPLLEATVHTRGRKTDETIPEDRWSQMTYGPILPFGLRPLTETAIEKVERPKMQQGALGWDRPQTQFMGYGGRFALPTEYVTSKKNIPMTDPYPPSKSQWERMMSWMPRQVQFTEGFQAIEKKTLAKNLLEKFYQLYNNATKYYLDAVFPIPQMSSDNLTNSDTNITYSLSAGSGNPWQLFDKSLTTHWTVAAQDTSKWFIKITLSKATTLTSIFVTKSDNNDRSFTSFKIEGSNTNAIINEEWTEFFQTSESDISNIQSSNPKVGVTLNLPEASAAYIKYRITFLGATGSSGNVSMHSMQLYGGDIPISLYNLIDPWLSYVTKSGNTYTVRDNLSDDNIKKYRFYKWHITGLRENVIKCDGMQISRFRFLREDGGDYIWNTRAVETSNVDTANETNVSKSSCRSSDTFNDLQGEGNFLCGVSSSATSAVKAKYESIIKAGTSDISGGDFVVNPGGRANNTIGIDPMTGDGPTQDCINGLRTDGHNETPNIIAINDYTIDGQTYTYPTDVNESNQSINRTIKKIYDRGWGYKSPKSSTLIFILQEPQLFSGFRYITANDKDKEDPVTWTFYGSNKSPYTDLSQFTGGRHPFKDTDVAVADVGWDNLNSYTIASVTKARGATAGPFILQQKTDALRQAYSSAYKELSKIIINKFMTVQSSMGLTSDTTMIDSLNSSCSTVATSSSTLSDVYSSSLQKVTDMSNVSLTTISENVVTINDVSIITTTISDYITFADSSETGAWPTLYQRIKCMALNPLSNYITYVGNLPVDSILPTGYPTLDEAQSNKTDINSTANVISVMSIVGIYETYTELIRKAKAYFSIKQFMKLMDESSEIRGPPSTWEASIIVQGHGTLTELTTLQLVYTKGIYYTTLTTDGVLSNLPSDDLTSNNIIETYETASKLLLNGLLFEFRKYYDLFNGPPINMQPSLGLISYYSDASEDITSKTANEIFTMGLLFLGNSGYFNTLMEEMKVRLSNYHDNYLSIRNWLTSPSTTTDVNVLNVATPPNPTKGMGVQLNAMTPSIASYTATAPAPINNLTAIYNQWNEVVEMVGVVVGSNSQSLNSIRKTIYDKIVEFLYLYDNNISYLSAYETIYDDASTDQQTIGTTVDVGNMVTLWNKYNIIKDVEDTIQDGKQLEFQGIISDYNALYDAYFAFQVENATYTTHTLLTTLSQNPSLTRTKPNEVVSVTGLTPTYPALLEKYGNSNGSGLYASLLGFVRGQLESYINAFGTLFFNELPNLEAQNIDTSFFSDSIRSSDNASIITDTASALIIKITSYRTYSDQLRARNDRYNTLIVMNHFNTLALENEKFSFFPTNLHISGTCPTGSGATITFTEEADATIQLANFQNTLICDIIGDTVIVRNIETTAADLRTVRNKYIAAFEWLFETLKANLLLFITEYETLRTTFVGFKTDFSAFSVMSGFSHLVEPTPTGSSISYKSSLTSLSFTHPNQVRIIGAFKTIRNAYVGNTGVYTLLLAHIHTQLTSFRSILESRIQSSLALNKPLLPAIFNNPFQSLQVADDTSVACIGS